jgi:hypothetical protein
MMDRIEAAIRAADVVLIPVRASIFDVEAIAPVTEVCKDYGKTYAFVLSHADPKWKLLPATIDALSDYGPVLAEQLRYNQAYATALTVGKTAAEIAGRVAAEPRRDRGLVGGGQKARRRCGQGTVMRHGRFPIRCPRHEGGASCSAWQQAPQTKRLIHGS